MNKTLQFSASIRAPRDQVWAAMLERPTYEQWTSAFCEGSTYEGGWNRGDRIRFLTPSGEGMVSEIVESRRPEFVSIRHLGELKDGVEKIPAPWAPAMENYSFKDEPGGTRVVVDIDAMPEYEQFMKDTFPKALARLKDICEAR